MIGIRSVHAPYLSEILVWLLTCKMNRIRDYRLDFKKGNNKLNDRLDLNKIIK